MTVYGRQTRARPAVISTLIDRLVEGAVLWDASVIKGYAIEARDGRLGTVSDSLFEDASWMIRWLVVDTGHWLPGRKVLLARPALAHPDPQSREFPVKLTMRQVKDVPISIPIGPCRARWRATSMTTTAGTLTGRARWQRLLSRRFTCPDPSCENKSALVDDAGWNIRYIVVDTRNWWPGEQILISPRIVREIEWADRPIHLNVNRQRVKDSRAYEPSEMADRANEDLMIKYYRRRL